MIKIKSLFISDIHLGNPNSQPEKLLEVFKKYEFENLFIIGDFIDLTFLKRRYYWNQYHSTVIQKVLRYDRKGINVVYILGNHDHYLRTLIENSTLEEAKSIKLGNIIICDDYIYKTISNEKIYITHGDCFDGFIRVHPFLYWLGDTAYEFSIKINKIYNFLRKIFGLEYWSLSAYLKIHVKSILSFLSEYKKISQEKLKNEKCDSLMMGHIHSPLIENGKYYNTGDWVESCSYIIEDLEGKIELKYVK
jgi:UDP-2,3-diacylglucosamine pyrophosphatase LpxH